MFFLIRVAFWLCVVLALLPSAGSKQSAPPAIQTSAFDAVGALSAATATVSDMSQFCTRQPDACAAGSHVAVAFGQRAQAGAKMVYDMLNERLQPQATGSVAKPATAKPSQNTLTPADLRPAWQGPQPNKDARSRHSA
jgi:hypothetical protein